MNRVLIDNKPVAVSNTEIKFGLKAISKPTPALATKIFRVILYLAALGNIVVDVFPEIPLEVKGMIAMYSIKAVALVHAITKLFGLEEAK